MRSHPYTLPARPGAPHPAHRRALHHPPEPTNPPPPPQLLDSAAGILLADLDPDTSRLLPVRRKRHHVRVQGRLAVVRSVSTANLRQRAQLALAASEEELPGLTGRQRSSADNSSSAGGRSSRSGAANGDGSPNRHSVAAFQVATSDMHPGASSPGSSAAAKMQKTARRASRFESAVGGAPRPSGRRKPTVRRRSYDGAPSRHIGGLGANSSDGEDDDRDISARDSQLRSYGIGGVGNIRRPTEVMHFPSSRRIASRGLFDPSTPMSNALPSEDQDRRKWHLRDFLGLPGGRKGKGRAR